MVLDQFKDRLIQILLIAACFTMIGGMLYYGILLGWVEGFSIIIATIFLVAIASANDYNKDR